MNKKLLIALPVLAILSLTAVAVLSHKNHNLKAAAVDNVDFDSLRACQSNIKDRKCNEIDDDTQFSKCQGAANTFALLTQTGGDVLPACRSYYTRFNSGIAQDKINANGDYVACFTDAKVLSAVKNSDFFYRYIFAPKYLDCAKISI